MILKKFSDYLIKILNYNPLLCQILMTQKSLPLLHERLHISFALILDNGRIRLIVNNNKIIYA